MSTTTHQISEGIARATGSTGRNLELGSRFAHGANGAWACHDVTTGERFVIKVVHDPSCLTKVAWSAIALPILIERGWPGAMIEGFGALPTGEGWVLQRRLEGDMLDAIDESTLRQLMDAIEKQGGLKLEAPERDGSWWVSAVLFDDHAGWWEPAKSVSKDAEGLLDDVQSWIFRCRDHPLSRDDVVHLNLHAHNVLSDGKQITGIIDYDNIGIGSRAVDLSTVLFDRYRLAAKGQSQPRRTDDDTIIERMFAVAGETGARLAIAYEIIADLAYWAGTGKPTEASYIVPAARAVMTAIGN